MTDPSRLDLFVVIAVWPKYLSWWPALAAEDGRECEVRLRRFDGDFQGFSLRSEPLCDATGTVVRWYGTWINVDDTKQKELLGVGGRRTVELIADGAGISETLNQLCFRRPMYMPPRLVEFIDRFGKRAGKDSGQWTRNPQERFSHMFGP